MWCAIPPCMRKGSIPVGRDAAAQLIYSYKVKPRTAFYAGTPFGGFMDDANPDLFNNSRSLFLKFSYAWQPEF